MKYNKRQLLEPATDAREWQLRLELDLEKNTFSNNLLANLYAELPPQDQWPAVRASIDKLTGDLPRFERLNAKNRHSNNSDMLRKKLILFSGMLKGGETDHEPALRNLFLTGEISEHERKDAVGALLMISKDTEASLTWLKNTKPELLEISSYEKKRDREKKTDWEEALAVNRIDEGIALLKAAIARENNVFDKAGLLKKLIRIALVLERKELAEEASGGLMATLMDAIKANDSFSYTYEGLLDPQAIDGDWKGIIDAFKEITEAYAKMEGKPSPYDLGHLDNAHATYLTALHELGKTAEFRQALEEIQMQNSGNPGQFFDFLGKAAKGHAPLGLLYVDSLKAAGQTEEALAFALRLLARDSGNDAFYEFLIGLDEARATAFIRSLRTFDPYEERPLIWLAEIARRNNDLELAQKTIDEAIALDPSDGDHGKDSRMFCYEVLARIHSDAGRKEKAEFFRSVVDSIRQGEAADDYLHAGLIREATDRYEKALGQFADAYCLQSRLAMTLARNGRFDEAVVHFKKAFSLMPMSFGPRESHCFGCEGLFNDERVIEIAKPLLEAFEKENPDNPRAPYLLGLILSEKNEEAQAALAFRRALKLDPLYFNAATRLLSILEKDSKSFRDAEALRKQMFAIAPYTSKPDYMPNQSDLTAHWRLCEEFPPSPLNLPPIPFARPPAEKKAQYLELEDINGAFSYSNYKSAALDGWSASELRRANKFLKFIDGLD